MIPPTTEAFPAVLVDESGSGSEFTSIETVILVKLHRWL